MNPILALAPLITFGGLFLSWLVTFAIIAVGVAAVSWLLIWVANFSDMSHPLDPFPWIAGLIVVMFMMVFIFGAIATHSR